MISIFSSDSRQGHRLACFLQKASYLRKRCKRKKSDADGWGVVAVVGSKGALYVSVPRGPLSHYSSMPRDIKVLGSYSVLA